MATEPMAPELTADEAATEQRSTAPRSAARVFYDGHCGACRRAAAWARRLDWFGRLELVSFRHEDSYVEAGIECEALEQELHVASASRVWRGFPAVLTVLRYLPLLWPLLPFCWAAGRVGLGRLLYRWFATNRVVLTGAAACSSDGC